MSARATAGSESGQLTPYVYIFEFVSWLATLTAQSPTHSEITSLSYVCELAHVAISDEIGGSRKARTM